jgi:hypothetical protein
MSSERSELDQGGVRGPAFYCVADHAYFLGAVALINSLRLVGHDEPIFVLDCGLAPGQREQIARQSTVLPAPRQAPPWLLKTAAPLSRPSGAMALLDADMVVCRPLVPLLEEAAAGRLVAFRNPIDRFVPEWGDLLELGPAHRRPYVSSAAMLFGKEIGLEVLGLLADRQARVDFDRTYWRRNVSGYPFLYADQDVLNAILATRVPPEQVVVHPHRLAPTPPFEGLAPIDERRLRCAYLDGVEPYLLHHHVAKPWRDSTYHGVYSRLLRRLLVGPDIAIRVPEEQLPLRMRTGPLAYAARARVNARERFRWHVRDPLLARVRPRGSGEDDSR